MKRIFVSGSPGALTSLVAKRLYHAGWDITWPKQDLNIFNGQAVVVKESYYKNIELELMAHAMCPDQLLLNANLPEYVEIPNPGPKEYLSMFPDKVVLNSVLFAPYLNIWVPYVDAVIDVQASELEDIQTLHEWTDKAYAEDYLKLIRRTHKLRYNRHLNLFDKVFRFTNEEVRANYFEDFDRFLRHENRKW